MGFENVRHSLQQSKLPLGGTCIVLSPWGRTPHGGPTRCQVQSQGCKEPFLRGCRDGLHILQSHTSHGPLSAWEGLDSRSPQAPQPRHSTFESSALSSSSSASVRPSAAGVWVAPAASTGTSIMASGSRPLLGEFRLISARDKMSPESASRKEL